MSWFKDNSKKNYQDKKMLFCGLGKLLVVSPSIWLEGHLHNSFLNEYEIMVINNGIDLDIFNPLNDKTKRIKLKLSKKYILGVANSWSRRKGLEDILELSKYLDPEIDIVLVGLSNKQIINLPSNIIGINRINNPKELASLYAGAEVFINPTYVDNFPTVNLESLACGTPVITYNTGGSPETLDERTGLVIDKGDIEGLLFSINQFVKIGKIPFSHFCRDRAEKLYNKMDRFQDYTNLYESLLC
jgi:glycosyltransferase involved in cell wall biosynthesis